MEENRMGTEKLLRLVLVTGLPMIFSLCTEGGPKKIAILQYFSMFNEDMREVAQKGWTIHFSNYEILSQNHGKASSCIGCGQCEKVCPRHLPIINNLKAEAKLNEVREFAKKL